jgi:hypothetical protein
VGEDPDHPDVANRAGLEKLHAAGVVWPDAPVQIDLNNAFAFARDAEHGPAFVHSVAGRLLDEDVRAGFHRGDGLQRMPVIRCGNQHDLGFLLFEQFAEIVVRFWRVAVQIVDLLRRDLARIAVDVAQSDHFDPSAGDSFLENILSPPAAANQRGAELLRRIGGADERRGHQNATGHRGVAEELAARRQGQVFHG